jgi:hypothetical protein
MTISNFQVDSVIKTYMKNMKIRARQFEENPKENDCDYELDISKEGMKKMMYERMEKQMAEKLKTNDR